MTISSRARALLLLLDNVGVDLDRARRLARARAPVDRWAQLSKAPTQVSIATKGQLRFIGITTTCLSTARKADACTRAWIPMQGTKTDMI